MNTLIVPAAGKSSRYPNAKPKWLFTHPDGSLMIEKSINCMLEHKFDRIVVTILKKHCVENEADIILKQAFGDLIEICILEEETQSAAETVYKTIKNKNIKDQICIKDTDCYIKFDSKGKNNYIVGFNVDQNTKINNLQAKSFILSNSDNIINDIIEKKLVSNTICVGAYCLSSEDFIESYEQIINSDVFKLEKEIYVSHIISNIIQNNKKIFEQIIANKFIDWGTMEEWNLEQDKFKTYFFDIDGIILKNTGKYGEKNWSNSFEPIQENIEILKKINDSGGEIIFVTCRKDEHLLEFKQMLEKNKIKYKTIISGCNHSKRIMINDYSYNNSYPSCESISVPRNSLIKQYLKI